MPLMRCTNEDCGHEFFHRSRVSELSDCEECGEPAEPVDTYHERDDALDHSADQERGLRRPRLVYARDCARTVLDRYDVASPPVPVREIARREGFTVRDHPDLGALRARLRGELIEVAETDSEPVKRFSIAHELGHHFLKTAHEDGREAEIEANAFAGELLVPGPQLLAAVEQTTSAAALANRFQVSQAALRIAAEHHRKAGLLTS